ncbi:hypothetical protein CHARACLAT_014635 [Characodon lateralis]|uniref:Uncharacterized protein n=1 Tax=Characodon lateralis TaxID=208331 RepID=A0ABU7CXL4_9TELE|nr:hypothetical protein [Characodon lateralis]
MRGWASQISLGLKTNQRIQLDPLSCPRCGTIHPHKRTIIGGTPLYPYPHLRLTEEDTERRKKTGEKKRERRGGKIAPEEEYHTG